MKTKDIPMRRLGESEIATLIMGQSPGSDSYNFEKNGIPFYQGKTDFGRIHPSARVWCSKPLRIANKDDVLISVRAPVGDANLADERCCLGRGVAAVRPSSLANAVYMFFAIQSVKPKLESLSTGTTFESVNKTALEELEIPFPSKAEQEKIAAILWKAQQAINAEEKLVAASLELKKTTLEKVFTQGLKNEAQKITEIGAMPESWDVVQINEKAKLTAGGTPSRSIKEYWIGGDIPWVKTGEVDYCVITDTEEKITSSGMENSAAKLLPAGTLLVAMYGQGITRGKVAILGIEATTNQACVGLIPKDNDLVPEYLYYYLSHSYERLRSFSHGAQQQNLNKELVGSFQFPWPKEKKEQEEIVTILKTIDQKISVHKKKMQSFEDLFQTLLHQFMNGEISVADLDIDTSDITS